MRIYRRKNGVNKQLSKNFCLWSIANVVAAVVPGRYFAAVAVVVYADCVIPKRPALAAAIVLKITAKPVKINGEKLEI